MGKRVDREGPIQRAIIAWLRSVMPHAIVHHCKNEINKRGVNIAREIAAAKRNGMVPGFPDLLVLPSQSCPAFFLEVKAEGNYAQSNQKALHEQIRANGFNVAVVRSVDDVRECLDEWGIYTTEIRGQSVD